MSKRARFPDISARSWSHPGDAEALASFARLPGAGEILGRLAASTTEASLRLTALASWARVSDSQFPEVHRLVVEAAAILDLAPLPEVYIKLGSFAEISSLGLDRPFLVLSSAALDFWAEDELLAVIGHELGHILSGHAIYKTLLAIIQKAHASFGEGLISAAAFAALSSGLRKWDLFSEFSADRAGLLCAQDPQAVYRGLMKSAGGPRASGMDLNEFFRQTRDYEAAAASLDPLHKILDLLGDRQDFPGRRMVALQEWERGGGYASVLKGDYPRRSQDPPPDSSFGGARAAQDPLARAAGAVMDALGGILGAGGPRDQERPKDKAEEGQPHPGPSVEDLLDELFRKG